MGLQIHVSMAIAVILMENVNAQTERSPPTSAPVLPTGAPLFVFGPPAPVPIGPVAPPPTPLPPSVPVSPSEVPVVGDVPPSPVQTDIARIIVTLDDNPSDFGWTLVFDGELEVLRKSPGTYFEPGSSSVTTFVAVLLGPYEVLRGRFVAG